MIAILDYGSGNLRSAERAIARSGVEVKVSSNFDFCLSADGLLIPGVGAFGQCLTGLLEKRGDELIKLRMAEERKTLGICVGMQILFSESEESPGVAGVGIFKSSIKRLQAPITPHMGWDTLSVDPQSKLFAGISDQRFYFVHSYAAKEFLSEDLKREPKIVTTMASYGGPFIAAIEYGSLSATQFHPEKSGNAGLKLLDNWVTSCKESPR
ncbi:MAG: imidazole glycerol phosphate synthase subunit HisH [Actinobacteria bacterium]|nr:imidazole glycerol phosphate synthase subunit HisH [Actinomycetota bacterium]